MPSRCVARSVLTAVKPMKYVLIRGCRRRRRAADKPVAGRSPGRHVKSTRKPCVVYGPRQLGAIRHRRVKPICSKVNPERDFSGCVFISAFTQLYQPPSAWPLIGHVGASFCARSIQWTRNWMFFRSVKKSIELCVHLASLQCSDYSLNLYEKSGIRYPRCWTLWQLKHLITIRVIILIFAAMPYIEFMPCKTQNKVIWGP